jgi:hypothetical protein
MARTLNNPWHARQSGSIFSATVDFDQIRKLAYGLTRDAPRAHGAILQANRELAMWLQSFQSDALDAAIKGRKGGPRAQRSTRYLSEALLSAKNRRVSYDGFTVGYLDENAHVAPYWRNLETGTDVFVDRILRGFFWTGGQSSRPARGGGQDARFSQMRVPQGKSEHAAHVPYMKIHNPITGYHYLAEGWKRFEAEGFTAQGAVDEYALAFSERGMDFFLRFMDKTGGSGKRVRPRTGAPSDGG